MSSVLRIFLKDREIGSLIHLPGERNVFTFHEDYIDDPNRPRLSLSFQDIYGDLMTDVRSTQTRLPPFFSNLLPEGLLRTYLAQQLGASSQREFHLFALLGEDLPGALKAIPAEDTGHGVSLSSRKDFLPSETDPVFHFSLAGVQLKFPATKVNDGGLTVPLHGLGGSWILKLPDARYAHVPENEFAMMSLAKAVGIDVPEILLVPLRSIEGLPESFSHGGNTAFAIKRFDRDEHKGAFHMEDFAQILSIYPEKKYTRANYRTIANIVWKETGEAGIKELIRRFVFMVLTGNGDMHLKNWSLLYLDGVTPTLAPVYDFVSTIPYIPGDGLALNFSGKKTFQAITQQDFQSLALKAHLPEKMVMDTVEATREDFFHHWAKAQEYGVSKALKIALDAHLKGLAL